jgi:hypothetical protein
MFSHPAPTAQLQCDPRSADAQFGIGSVKLDAASNAAERESAMKHIERAVEIDPLHSQALARLASNAVGGEYLSAVRPPPEGPHHHAARERDGDKAKQPRPLRQ